MSNIKVFQDKKIRSVRNKRYFSVEDVVGALTGSANPTDYLKKRKRDQQHGAFLGGQIVPR